MIVPSNEANDLINSLYPIGFNGGELEHLSYLFDKPFLQGLDLIMQKNNPAGSEVIIDNRICWIDKVPLAEFPENTVQDHLGQYITSRVELGDALFLSIENYYTNSGVSSRSKALILQAKVTDKITIPRVPVGTASSQNSSSLKEIALLEHWPRFDLYKASRSKRYLLNNIDIPQLPHPQPYSWYCVAQRNGSWPHKWYVAPSIFGSAFNHNMGDMLSCFYGDQPLSGELVGVDFDLKSSADSWSALINKIIDICQGLGMPEVVSSVIGSKIKRIVAWANSSNIRSHFLINDYSQLNHWFPFMLCNNENYMGFILNYLSSMTDELSMKYFLRRYRNMERSNIAEPSFYGVKSKKSFPVIISTRHNFTEMKLERL